ncbi:hypothetical protein V493_07581, partial [Pseudogymnoascus sp. VKM F-4281 (FW-2241)]
APDRAPGAHPHPPALPLVRALPLPTNPHPLHGDVRRGPSGAAAHRRAAGYAGELDRAGAVGGGGVPTNASGRGVWAGEAAGVLDRDAGERERAL